MSAQDARSRADREFHDATAALYDATLAPIFGVFHPLVVRRMLDELVASAPGGRALDAGCGTGAVALRLAERGMVVEGIDHSAGMLAVARREAVARGLVDRVRLRQGDVRELPYADASFDVVSCHGVLHHLQDPAAVIHELARVLRPGGWFSTAEPCVGSVPTVALWGALRRVRGVLGRRAASSASVPPSPVDASPPPGFQDTHEEASLDARVLLDTLRGAGLDPQAEYWTHFPGLEGRSLRVQKLVNRELTRPWRHRRGSIVFITARRRG